MASALKRLALLSRNNMTVQKATLVSGPPVKHVSLVVIISLYLFCYLCAFIFCLQNTEIQLLVVMTNCVHLKRIIFCLAIVVKDFDFV